MSIIEYMAAIIAIIILIKILVILISPKSWMAVVKFFYGNPMITMVLSAILAIGSFWYLMQELTIVQIFAVLFLMSMLMFVSLSVYSKDMIPIARKLLQNRKFMARAWLSIIIWLVLTIWVLKELFF